MTFSKSIDISAPPSVVWGVMSDIERWHEWTASVTSVKQFGKGPIVPGTRALIRQPKFPPAMWKVQTVNPNANFIWVSVAPGLRVTANHSVLPIAGGSRATLSIQYEGLLGGVMARLTRAITERYLEMEANGLKKRGEQDAEMKNSE